MITTTKQSLGMKEIVKKLLTVDEVVPIIKAYLVLIADIIDVILEDYVKGEPLNSASDSVKFLNDFLVENYDFFGLEDIGNNLAKIEEKVLYDDILLTREQETRFCLFVIDTYYMLKTSELRAIFKEKKPGSENKKLIQGLNNQEKSQKLNLPSSMSYLRPLIGYVKKSETQGGLGSKIFGKNKHFKVPATLKPMLNDVIKNQVDTEYDYIHEDFSMHRDLTTAVIRAGSLKDTKTVLSEDLDEEIEFNKKPQNRYMMLVFKGFFMFLLPVIIFQLILVGVQIVTFPIGLQAFLVYLMIFGGLSALCFYVYKKI